MIAINSTMNIIRMGLFSAAVLLLSSSIASGQENSDSTDGSKTSREADLEQLSWWISMEHSFSDSLRHEAHAAIAGHRADSTLFSDAEFYMEVRRIVALAENGHTNVSGGPIHDTFGLLPLRAYWFSDGLYIVWARDLHRDLLGARIDAINGKPIADLATQLMDYHGGNREFFQRYYAPILMFSPALMNAIGVSQDAATLTLQMTDRTGKVLESDVRVDLETKSANVRPWRYLHPAPLEYEVGWSTFHDSTWSLPLQYQEEEEPYRYLLLDGGDVAYIQLRLNMDSGDESIDGFLSQTKKRLLQDRPRSIILDNRNNPGGDLTRTADFALELPSLASPEGMVYVLTGSGTFSAAIYTSFYPKAADPERTIIVGEHVGDWTRFWAETGPSFVLRDAGYRIGYSLQIHDLAVGCTDPVTCCMARFPDAWNIAVGSFEPDWPVSTTFVDYEAGRDQVLERVLEDVREHTQIEDRQ